MKEVIELQKLAGKVFEIQIKPKIDEFDKLREIIINE